MRINNNRGTPADGPDPIPRCARDAKKLLKTLDDIESNILEVTRMDGISDKGVAAIKSLVNDEISDMTNNPAFVDVIGGHINLTLAVIAVQSSLSTNDYDKFQSAFSGAAFGQRREAGAATMHSDLWKNQQLFDFHFDLFNPKKDVVGLVGHLFGDVIGGHIGTPCLDPAWRSP